MYDKNYVLSLQTMNSSNAVSELTVASITTLISLWSLNCSTLSVMWCDNGPVDRIVDREIVHP